MSSPPLSHPKSFRAAAPKERAGAWWSAAEWGVLLLVGTLISWAATGQVFGAGNVVYHLPIVGSLDSLPQFADDAFIQSLHGFTSGLWMLVAGSDHVIAPEVLFAAMFLVSKVLILWGMALIAQELGLTGFVQRAMFIALVALMPLLRGQAFAGHGGMFMNYATHSEIATGIALLMLWACMRRRFDMALALNGVVFFLNGFMAIWLMAPWLWLLVDALRRDRALWGQQRAGLGWAALVAVLCAAPVLSRAFGTGALGGAPAPFDYRVYLADTYPFHFLPQEMPLGQWLGLAAVVAVALMGLHAIGSRAAPLGRALAAFGVVYAVGLVLPSLLLTHLTVGLHLLRVSVFAQLIAGIVVAVTIVQGLGSSDPRRRWLWAPAMLLCALLPRPAIVGMLVMAVLQGFSAAPPEYKRAGLRRTGAALLLACAVGVGVQIHRTAQVNDVLRQSVADWSELARQIGQRTEPNAMVMLPFETDSWAPPDAGAGVFEYDSHRRVWADRKRGAAVLWRPSYHAQWQQRTEGLEGLGDWAARLAYARAHRIDVVVDRCDGLGPEFDAQRLATVGRLCALRVAPAARIEP